MRLTLPRLLAALLVALSLPVVAAQAPEAASASCKLTRYATIPFDITPEGVVTLPVTIQGETLQMALHTSGTFNMIDEAMATRLKLQRTPLPEGMVKIGNQPLYHYAQPDTLQLGPVKFASPSRLLVPNFATAKLRSNGQPIQGTIGIQLFGRVDLDIDFPKRLLSLYSMDHCPGRVVYWSDTYDVVPLEQNSLGQFYFPMELNGAKLQATLATGTPHSMLSAVAAKKLLNIDQSDPDIVVEKADDGSPTGYYRAMELATDGLAIMNARVGLLTTSKSCRLVSSRDNRQPAYFADCGNIYPLLLGMNVLGKLHIYIATKEKKLYFTVAEPERATPTTPAPTPAAAP